jgi:FkbM family methyltransferase
MANIEVPGTIPVGHALTFTLRDSSAAADCYLVQNHILLPGAITLQPDEPFHYFPEAPGHYLIKGPDFEAAFDVVVLDIDDHAGPVFAQEMWFPSAWTAAVAAGHESTVMAQLPQIIKSGSVVYDIGANIGLYARQFLQLANSAGYVYCFEPNPIAIHYLQHNLVKTGSDNYLIFPVAVADEAGMIDLVVNPDNHGLGSLLLNKLGMKIKVEALTLDAAVAQFGLRPPDVIKMDIEGGETVAIKGMQETIARHRPLLIFELHGRWAARETLKFLGAYNWRIPGESRQYAAEQFADAFPDACLQVIGVARN